MNNATLLRQMKVSALALISLMILNVCALATAATAQDDKAKITTGATLPNAPTAPVVAMQFEPTVAFIHSTECPVCAKVRPILKDLQTEFKGRVRFVDLDVTDEKTKAASKAHARSLLLGQFFNLYSDSFPCVGIFDKRNKTVRELCGFNTKQKYEGYIRRALEQSLK